MKKSVNDIGGEDWGPIPLTQKEVPDWAKLSTALRAALGDNGARLVNLHEGRRAREEMGGMSAITPSAISRWGCRRSAIFWSRRAW